MAERRSLVEGIIENEPPRDAIEDFVFGSKSRPTAKAPVESGKGILPQFQGRVPLTSRVTPEIASAVKRASLTRQLNGQEPYHVQEIMEQALIAWLNEQGYQA